MAKKVQLTKMINQVAEPIYPRTTANNVIMDSGKTVETSIGEINTALTALTTKVNTMYDKLFMESVYMTKNGVTLNDGAGTNLVAVY